ncbi:MAG: S1 family peptidase [Sphingomonas oligoaromativorans]
MADIPLTGGIQVPSAASYCSTLIELHCVAANGEPIKVGEGTGFFCRHHETTFLITNWHVITGRNPNDPGKLIYPEQPTTFSLAVPLVSNKHFFATVHPIPLYTDGRPNWIEVTEAGTWDLVAIPLKFPSDAHVVVIQDFCHAPSLSVRPGRDVVIIGYPFGRTEGNPFPVWKRAMIASEPSATLNGRPQIYLDTPGRPGMSGSPVYFISEGMSFGVAGDSVPRSTGFKAADAWEHFMGNPNSSLAGGAIVLEFAGIYSGSMGDLSLDRLNLGLAWFSGLVSALLDKQRPGRNTFSPPAGSHLQAEDWQTVRWFYVDEQPADKPWSGATYPAS